MAGAKTCMVYIAIVMSNREFVIPTELEEWSDWEERHGRLRREGSGERVGRRTSSISYFSMTKTTEKIIVALDVASKKEALLLVEQLRDQISFFKIGLQLYTAAGPDVVREIAATGAKVFLDLKLHDIPHTVAHAVESASELGVQMLTIHLSGGSEMIRAAVAARKREMSILGVTVLTSSTQQTLDEIGIEEQLDRHVSRLGNLGVAAGIDGLVASPFEARFLRSELGDKIKIVVPGVRPSWADPGDQKRFMTPREAVEAGADYLVIGRPVTAHKNPREAVTKILSELES
ncbi:MAG TPA: orotidine-5'-phosphate decarboxylase [Chthoniobacterales bacterium]|nr:orotidine-5'-phosphate decarboxylase [Chthoniobacterales bacterium]